MPPAFQRSLFLDEVVRRGSVGSEREILDCYLTSLFNAWLDNQNLIGAEKRWVVAFSPRRAWGEGLDKFFELYPDGRLISILRDPFSWYTSAQGRDPEADALALLELWKRSAREMLEAVAVTSPVRASSGSTSFCSTLSGSMRGLAGYLDIEFDAQLTEPTFNRYPVGANSSYDVTRTGVVTDPVERYSELLSSKQQDTRPHRMQRTLRAGPRGRRSPGRRGTAGSLRAPAEPTTIARLGGLTRGRAKQVTGSRRARPRPPGSGEKGIARRRIARIEQALAAQAEQSNQLLRRLTLAVDARRGRQAAAEAMGAGSLDPRIVEALNEALRMRRATSFRLTSRWR